MENLKIRIEGCVCKNENELVENIKKQINSNNKGNLVIDIEGFNSYEDAKKFVGYFPKYVNVKATTIKFLQSKEYWVERGYNVFETDDKKIIGYQLYMSISCLTKVTGDINEMGEKRIKSFIKVCKKHELL